MMRFMSSDAKIILKICENENLNIHKQISHKKHCL